MIAMEIIYHITISGFNQFVAFKPVRKRLEISENRLNSTGSIISTP